jgi:TIR domain
MSEGANQPGLFISYRREDSAGYTGRLYDCLSERFGADRVFMDFDDIQPGDDFAKVIEEQVASCAVLLAVIGRKWIGCANAQGRLRLKDRKDFVRLEILSALKRGIRAVPVLVGGATLPLPGELPKALQPLVRRQAFEINDAHFRRDAAALIDALETTLGSSTVPSESRDKLDPGQINGPWVAEARPEGGDAYEIFLNLEHMGGRLFGTVSYPTGTAGIQEGRLEGDDVSFLTKHKPQFSQEEVTIQWQAKFGQGEIQGVIQSRDGFSKFKARKDAKARHYGWVSG